MASESLLQRGQRRFASAHGDVCGFPLSLVHVERHDEGDMWRMVCRLCGFRSRAFFVADGGGGDDGDDYRDLQGEEI